MASFPLDKRCKEILQSIIYASGFIKVQTIADQMGVSKRSIYYDLNKMQLHARNEATKSQRNLY